MQDRPRPSVRSASIATLTALALGSTFAGGFAGTAYADSLPGQGAQQGITFDRVTICHATGSTSNPFVQITPSKIGVVNGHLNHQDAADIVPAFTYVDYADLRIMPTLDREPLLLSGSDSVRSA
jgi:hypothetical protein